MSDFLLKLNIKNRPGRGMLIESCESGGAKRY
jgi:hypothetical protein